MIDDPFGEHNYQGSPYWLRPQQPELERKRIALLNRAQLLLRASEEVLRAARLPPGPTQR